MSGEAALPRESAAGSQGQDPGSLQPAELLPAPRWAERNPPACAGAAAEAELCLLPSIRVWDGKREGLHPSSSPRLWDGDSTSDRRKGLRAGGENSAGALAEEQKSPPFPQAGLSCFKLL